MPWEGNVKELTGVHRGRMAGEPRGVGGLLAQGHQLISLPASFQLLKLSQSFDVLK